MLNTNPVMMMFTLIVIVNTIFSFIIAQVRKAATGNSDTEMNEEYERSMLEARNNILSFMFPILMTITFVQSSGLFVTSTVHDREQKLRYLLKLSGISSTSYFLGIFLAEIIIFMVPILLLILLGTAFQLRIIEDLAPEILLTFFFFGISFLQINYLIGFMFSTTATAFKNQPIILWISIFSLSVC